MYEKGGIEYIYKTYCSGKKNDQGDRKSGIFDDCCCCRAVRFRSRRTWKPLAFDDCKYELRTKRLVGIEIMLLLLLN